ncbi:MAG: DUF4344 domain-containing metallopeptidase [Pseudomonadota bacterium]|nr:DUF4344 domain-containing metallopeptidase [Pseudomonadota bacterium]
MLRHRLCAAMILGLTGATSTYAADSIQLAPPQVLFKQSISLQQFVRGTLRFIMLHEAGHALVDLYQLPILGREEDAVDRFAAWLMSPQGVLGDDGTDAIAAMEWWFASAQVDPSTRQQLPWWGEHAMDEQRAYQIACLIYGRNPTLMQGLAVRLNIPEKRRHACQYEAQQNHNSWARLLQPQVAQPSSTRQPFSQFLVPINYLPANAQTQQAATWLQNHQMLEQLQGLLHQFKPSTQRAMIQVTAQNCGTANAFWNLNTKSLTICYEMVNHVLNVGYQTGFR